MSTRWAAELKGDFDESYLAKQSHVYVKRKMGARSNRFPKSLTFFWFFARIYLQKEIIWTWFSSYVAMDFDLAKTSVLDQTCRCVFLIPYTDLYQIVVMATLLMRKQNKPLASPHVCQEFV